MENAHKYHFVYCFTFVVWLFDSSNVSAAMVVISVLFSLKGTPVRYQDKIFICPKVWVVLFCSKYKCMCVSEFVCVCVWVHVCACVPSSSSSSSNGNFSLHDEGGSIS